MADIIAIWFAGKTLFWFKGEDFRPDGDVHVAAGERGHMPVTMSEMLKIKNGFAEKVAKEYNMEVIFI